MRGSQPSAKSLKAHRPDAVVPGDPARVYCEYCHTSVLLKDAEVDHVVEVQVLCSAFFQLRNCREIPFGLICAVARAANRSPNVVIACILCNQTKGRAVTELLKQIPWRRELYLGAGVGRVDNWLCKARGIPARAAIVLRIFEAAQAHMITAVHAIPIPELAVPLRPLWGHLLPADGEDVRSAACEAFLKRMRTGVDGEDKNAILQFLVAHRRHTSRKALMESGTNTSKMLQGAMEMVQEVLVDYPKEKVTKIFKEYLADVADHGVPDAFADDPAVGFLVGEEEEEEAEEGAEEEETGEDGAEEE